jgi:hypothetical protein
VLQTKDGRKITDPEIRTWALLIGSRPEKVRQFLRGDTERMRPSLRVRIAAVLREHGGIEVDA